MNKEKENLRMEHPDQLASYFKKELLPLSLVTISGIIYNIGLTAGPFFEGQLAQRLYDIMNSKKTVTDMISMVILYVLVILIVQGMRAVKRFYVRRFANDTSRNMRHMLYNNIIHTNKSVLEQEQVGSLMTKAITDVDACVEGMRKFTTEVFDTGIALIAYLVMLYLYDWRLTLISCAFTPFAYLMAQKLKTVVYRYNSSYKKSAGALAGATMDRISNTITYRVFGQEADRDIDYEKHLEDYEKKAVYANIWTNTPQPIYNIISMTGVIFILYFGGKNVLGTGWTSWNIAAFTTFLSCFAKMALKSSKAAKLFHSVQKAQVSWKRIKPWMKSYIETDTRSKIDVTTPKDLVVTDLTFSYEKDKTILSGLSFKAKPGDIIGITGPVAGGKSTLGKVFLCESAYGGSVKIGGYELSDLSSYERSRLVSYLGHQPELMSDTLEENIRLGDTKSVDACLDAVCLTKETQDMPNGKRSYVGNGGIQLSGGQQTRVALARALYHQGNILVLDDPFSAVDHKTEIEIMQHLRELAKQSILLIISHRVTLFSEFNQVIWIEDGQCIVDTHDRLLLLKKDYAHIYQTQTSGGDLDEKE